MSEVAAKIVKEDIVKKMQKRKEYVIGLAAGYSPTSLYKYFAKMANDGEFKSSNIRSFNLDEYVGLPGENSQQRTIHPESYCYFMIKELFSLLKNKFNESTLPYGSLIDQEKLIEELKKFPSDWKELGTDAGKSIVIKDKPKSKYLAWIQREVLNAYEKKIQKFDGIDLQIIGVGSRGHIAFHESGIPFEGSRVMLIKLDNNTVKNAILDGHFSSEKDSPHYAISMGAEIVYKAKTVLLLANGERKTKSVGQSLLEDPTLKIPISYGQIYAKNGGNLIYVVDKIAGKDFLDNINLLRSKEIEINNIAQ